MKQIKTLEKIIKQLQELDYEFENPESKEIFDSLMPDIISSLEEISELISNDEEEAKEEDEDN